MTQWEREQHAQQIEKMLADRHRDLDRCLDLYAKLIVEIELLNLEGRKYHNV